jgi:hypothetical protein
MSDTTATKRILMTRRSPTIFMQTQPNELKPHQIVLYMTSVPFDVALVRSLEKIGDVYDA